LRGLSQLPGKWGKTTKTEKRRADQMFLSRKKRSLVKYREKKSNLQAKLEVDLERATVPCRLS